MGCGEASSSCRHRMVTPSINYNSCGSVNKSMAYPDGNENTLCTSQLHMRDPSIGMCKPALRNVKVRVADVHLSMNVGHHHDTLAGCYCRYLGGGLRKRSSVSSSLRLFRLYRNDTHSEDLGRSAWLEACADSLSMKEAEGPPLTAAGEFKSANEAFV